MSNTVDPSSRILTRISDAELMRRWAAVRRIMKDCGIDAIVMQNTNDWLGGYVKWFTDLPANNGYPRTVVFHLDAPMSVVEMGQSNVRRNFSADETLRRGVGLMLHTPSFTSIGYTDRDDVNLAIEALRSHPHRSIGLVTPGVLPYAFVAALKQQFAAASFIDVTADIDAIKAIKSEEEIALIRRTARLQDDVFTEVLKEIRPGLRDIDVTSIAQRKGQTLGSEQGIFLGGSSPLGIRSPFVPRYMQGRTLKRGDHLSLLIEINGPGGFYTEIARTVVLGKASSELKDGFAAVKAAQEYSLSLMKPGTHVKEIFAKHNAYMTRNGMPAESRLYAHGQGYDMVERPLIRQDDDMTLQQGMCLAVHPGYETPSLFAVICDNHLIEAQGPGNCLHRTAKTLFEID
jgi:Xaa-Pro aminopeptidase